LTEQELLFGRGLGTLGDGGEFAPERPGEVERVLKAVPVGGDADPEVARVGETRRMVNPVFAASEGGGVEADDPGRYPAARRRRVRRRGAPRQRGD
jgi:hypothetical protein